MQCDDRPWRAVWSPSRLRAAFVCPRKYHNEYGTRGWVEQRAAGNYRTEFGTMLHEALGVFDRVRAWGFAKDVATDVAVHHALTVSYGWDSGSTKMNRRNLVRAVVWYCDDQPQDYGQGLVAEGIEVALQAPMLTWTPDGQRHKIEAIFDVVGTMAGMPVAVERKITEGEIGMRFAERYSPDVQVDAQDLIAAFHGDLHAEPRQLIVEAHQIGVGFSRWYRWLVGRTPEQREAFTRDAERIMSNTELLMTEVELGKIAPPMNRAVCGFYDHDRGEGGCPWRKECAL